MEPVDHFNLRTFDLNLLLAFDALMQELSVTRAAGRLKIQQPAMSHALANLRLVFDDPLFVRSGHAMEATPRARALHEVIHPLLVQAQQALVANTGFDPGREQRTFRLGINGQQEAILLPAVIAHVARHAPNVRIQSVSVGDQPLQAVLDEDRLDVVIAHCSDSVPRLRREKLYREQYVCCFHPLLLGCAAPIGQAEYLAAMHGIVASGIDVSGFLGYLFQHAPGRPQIALSAHNVTTLLAAASSTPLVASLHGRLAARYASLFGLAVSPIPFPVDELEIDMFWHPRSDKDAALNWFRQLLRFCLP
ncbi:LysR family transcriptional regulator [uncultured Massilia sp.]|uniref:LysR family transcriptional regulator n=1 Tax=uncultured Massilia sp. TaxID=169973 RepID=UPI002588DC95|nr:LysR family transcriptional regulator [uncultured Massilia sp.]